LKVVDIDEGREVTLDERTEGYDNIITEKGDPGKYYLFGNRLWFDYCVDEEKYFRMEYLKIPADLTSADANKQLPFPAQFHDVVEMLALRIALKWDQDYTSAYSIKRDIEDDMRMLIDPYERSTERQEAGAEVMD